MLALLVKFGHTSRFWSVLLLHDRLLENMTQYWSFLFFIMYSRVNNHFDMVLDFA